MFAKLFLIEGVTPSSDSISIVQFSRSISSNINSAIMKSSRSSNLCIFCFIFLRTIVLWTIFHSVPSGIDDATDDDDNDNNDDIAMEVQTIIRSVTKF